MVTNQFPSMGSSTHRLAIIAAHPLQDDQTAGKPFANSGGRLLRAVLGNNNIVLEQCFVGYVNPNVPGDLGIDYNSYETQASIAQLLSDLDKYQPHCILVLGKLPFRVFRSDLCYEPERKTKENEGYVIPLDNWRGSITLATVGRPWKMVATYDPMQILKVYKDNPYFIFDVSRAVKESRTADYFVPERAIITRPSIDEVLRFIDDISANQRPFSTDIEGYADNVGVTMLSLAPSPESCLVIPFWIDGKHYWSEEEEIMVWGKLQEVYLNVNIRKKCHNAFYELFVLAWRHRILIRNVDEDTMLKQFEIAPQLEKSLAVCTTFYTKEPYYKDDRESDDTEKRLIYNGKDSACTEEVDRQQQISIQRIPRSYEHYRFNISLLPAFNYMHLRGCRFDQHRLSQHKVKAEADLKPLLDKLAAAAGREINPKSTDDKKWLLYEKLGFKPFARYGESTKEAVILRYWARDRSPLLKLLVQAINLRTRISDIGKLVCNEDGRIRCTYDLAGAGTARLSAKSSIARYAYVTKKGLIKWEDTGTNLQNQTKELRDCLLPDSPEFDFFQDDLAGADAWTVAADLAALGHPTMMEDLLAGIKPSKVLLLMLQYLQNKQSVHEINKLSRAELAKLTKPLGGDNDNFPYPNQLSADKMYLCMKRVQHGTNYVAKPETVSETIFKDTDGEIDLHPRDAATYQALYKIRYSVDARTDYIRRTLRDTKRIQTAVGFACQFYGIRPGTAVDDDIVRSAASLEPQANTTGVTNRALAKLWFDRENRRKNGSLFVEPLIQVHDALAGQFPSKLRNWARDKFKVWFDNPIIVHGIEVRIPVECNYGPNWKDTKYPL